MKRRAELPEPQKRRGYTQGPLDETFGQHAAFPVDPDESPVYEYLASVRRDAENDRVCHYVLREPLRPDVPSAVGDRPRLTAAFVKQTLDRLRSEKAAVKPVQIGIDLGDIDVGGVEDSCGLDKFDEETADLYLLDEHRAKRHNHEDKLGDQGQIPNENGDPGISRSHVTENEELAGATLHLNSETLPSPATELPQSAAKWREWVFKLEPPPQQFFQTELEHPTVIKLIVYYTKWLSASMPATLTQWIFATFVRLDEGLDSTELAIVRDLALKAEKVRQKLEALEDSSTARECIEMVLAVVSGYYGQRDLVEVTCT